MEGLLITSSSNVERAAEGLLITSSSTVERAAEGFLTFSKERSGMALWQNQRLRS